MAAARVGGLPAVWWATRTTAVSVAVSAAAKLCAAAKAAVPRAIRLHTGAAARGIELDESEGFILLGRER